MTQKWFNHALKQTIPVIMGYIVCGAAFGILTVDKGYPWWLSPLMGILMYAGAGQFLAVGLFATNAPVSAILIAELVLNIRHIVYGLPLISKFNKCGKYKPYLIYSLSDETFSLLTTVTPPQDAPLGPYLFTIAIFDQTYWVLGSLMGGIIGSLLPAGLTDGVDFSLTALFAVLAIEQFTKLCKKDKGDAK